MIEAPPNTIPVRPGALIACLALTFLAAIMCGCVRPVTPEATEKQSTAGSVRDRNLFTEYLGRTDAEIDAKIDAAWRHFFAGDEDSQRLYYPVGDNMAYIADTGNGDVRSEGISYGLMLTVQLDRRAEFDALWRWTKRHMYHAEGPRRGYFAWQCSFNGAVIDANSASDGEEWFAMALLFADHRWGSTPGDINYGAEAQALLRAMRDNDRGGDITSIFDLDRKQVVFVPTRIASVLTDPSYHLPAFYELWAKWDADAGGREFWAAAAATSREFFHRAAHPETGLMPEYAHFDGSPFSEPTFGPGKGDFRFDAFRTLGNVALDHAWFNKDPWQVGQSTRVLRFLASHGPRPPNQYTLDGRPLSDGTSPGLLAMAAVAALAADRDVGEPFVAQLWRMEPPARRFRYYDGLLYFLGLLQVSGRFQIIEPPAAP